MTAFQKTKTLFNSYEFLMYLFGLSLSTLLLGQAPSSIGLGLFCLFSVRYCIINKIKTRFSFSFLLPIALYVFFVLSLFWTVDDHQTIKGLQRTITLAVIPFTFAIIPKVKPKNYHLVLSLFTYSNAIFGLFFIIVATVKYAFNSQGINVFTYHNLVSILDLNAVYVSMVFSIAFFYLLTLKNKSALQNSLIVFFLILIVLLSSKTIISVILFSIIVYLLNKGF